MKGNLYFLRARLFPSVITAIPTVILLNLLLTIYFPHIFEGFQSSITILSKIGLSSAVIFMFVLLNQILSKSLFQRIFFKDELHFPSTNHLLYKDEYFDLMVKDKIRKKINDKFQISLMSQSDEISDEITSRKQIRVAVSQIRNLLRENRMLLQHNIEYGFVRNFLGGCVVGFLSSIFLILLGNIVYEKAPVYLGVIFSILAIIPILLSKLIIKNLGKQYSKILYEQFLTL